MKNVDAFAQYDTESDDTVKQKTFRTTIEIVFKADTLEEATKVVESYTDALSAGSDVSEATWESVWQLD